MTLDNLIAECRRVLAQPADESTRTRCVMLTLRGGFPRSGDRRRLAGRSGPLGRCVAEINDKLVLVEFSATEVLAWAETQAHKATP